MVTEKSTGNEYKRISTKELKLDESFGIRAQLNEDAIATYQEKFACGSNCPALKVQKGTLRVIDGMHRTQAAIQAGIKKLPCELLDVSDTELRALAYKYNEEHGVRINLDERNKLILNLREKDGKTQEEIGRVVKLSHNRVSEILALSATDNPSNDLRKKLKPDEEKAVIRLLLKGETQASIAKEFRVSQQLVSQMKDKFYDVSLAAYQSGKLKKEIAKDVGLEPSEVDSILKVFGDPLNFTPEESTLWPSFGIDAQFGQRHPGNIPALLVKNILCRLTKPGDLILDPFAGGGVAIDACADFVDRSCEAFDLTPVRDDIKPWDILKGPPPVSRPPDLIFLDPPYGPQKAGEYSKRDNDLANMPVEQFLKSMEKVFGYWNRGWLVCLMTVYTGDGLGKYVHLPSKIAEAMERTGWAFHERIVNQIGRAEGTNALSVSRLQKANEGRGWWSRRDDLDILIGRNK